MVYSGWETEDKLVYYKREECWRTREGSWEEEREGEEVGYSGLYKRFFKLVVVVPDSMLSNEPSLREKTIKFYYILRSLVIFRVDELVVYRDALSSVSENEYSLINDLYRYYLTPPYLRRKLVPLKDTLRFVGLTHPLRLLIHSVGREPREGEYRQGVVVKAYRGRVLVDAGLDNLFSVETRGCRFRTGDLIVFRVTSGYKGVVTREYMDKLYTGPRLVFTHSRLSDTIECLKDKGLYVLGTSRYGDVVSIEELLSLKSILRGYKGVAVLFGSPYHGLYDIASREGFKLEERVGRVLNTLPRQGVKTVRLEEAIQSTLTLLNLII